MASFTLGQVAQELQLPEGVIRRLSQAFQMPQQYCRPAAGQAKLWLFSAKEIRRLKTIQALLVEGHTLPELKAVVQGLEEFSEPPSPILSAPPSTASDEHDTPLMTYDQSAQMNLALAESTFDQYRHDNQMIEPPLAALASKLAEARETAKRTPASDIAHPSKGVSSPLKASFNKIQAASYRPSLQLKARAQQLQQELRAVPAF